MNQQNDSSLYLWCGLFFLIFIGIPLLYASMSDVINGFLLSIAEIELRPFARFSSAAADAREKILLANPAQLSWEQMSTVSHFVGSYLRWPMAILLCLLAGVGFNLSYIEKLRTRLNMDSLLAHNAEVFPCLQPILGRGKYLLSPESYDSGFWQVARTPLQFAAQHHLLLKKDKTPWEAKDLLIDNMVNKDSAALNSSLFDKEKATEVFITQLGNSYTGFEKMSLARQAIATVFLAHAAGKKEEAINFLNKISRSYTEQQPKQNKDTPPAAPSPTIIIPEKEMNALFAAHQHILMEPEIQLQASYELTLIMALLTRARKKGVLANAQYLWLRPIDRPLWYALNQCGGKAAWVEGYAAWSHALAQTKKKQILNTPHISGAVIGLEQYLSNQGWLASSSGETAFDEDFLLLAGLN